MTVMETEPTVYPPLSSPDAVNIKTNVFIPKYPTFYPQNFFTIKIFLPTIKMLKFYSQIKLHKTPFSSPSMGLMGGELASGASVVVVLEVLGSSSGSGGGG